GHLRGSSAIPGGTHGDQDSRPDGWRTERVDDWWKKISKTACPWPSRPAPCVPGSTSGINKTRSIEVCQDIRQYAMMQLWFSILFVIFLAQHFFCTVGSVQAAAPSTSATRSPIASMLYLSVERAQMTRGIAMLAVWVLLQAPSSLAATRQNKAYEDLQHKYETALQEIERLRSELAVLKGERTAVPAPPTGGAENTPGGDFLQ